MTFDLQATHRAQQGWSFQEIPAAAQLQELVYKLIREFPQMEHGESWKAEWGFVCMVIRKQGTNRAWSLAAEFPKLAFTAHHIRGMLTIAARVKAL